MKKTNKRTFGIYARKTAKVKRAEEQIDLAEMIPKLGQLSKAEAKKVTKAWQQAEAEFNMENDGQKLFNPTSMSNKTFLNFMNYLKLTVIDREIGYQREFVPKQDYEQEVAREFRKR
ncbi:MAG TPA: hypothetical protein VKG26_12445 [Bacteroidia bacterium]|nr:hypothetical protein [Bacteroidia bacterium]